VTVAASTAVPPGSDPGGTAPALALDGVTKRFGGLVAVGGVSLELPVGGRLAVIGPNGAGKSTLFKLIAGDTRVSDGTIHMFGADATRLGERRRARLGIARTFQVSNLFAELGLLDNLILAAQVGTGRSRRFWAPQNRRDEAGRAAEAALERVGLRPDDRRSVQDLSHGEKRQLEIAMALVLKPRLLLLDEPAAGLSAAERVVLRDILEHLPEGMTFLLIEHDMTLALELVDRVLCLDNGVPLAYGTPDEIRANPAVQAVYLGRRD